MSTPPIQLRSTPFFARGRVSLHRAAISRQQARERRRSRRRSTLEWLWLDGRLARRRGARARPAGAGRRARRRRPGRGARAGADGRRIWYATGRAWSASWRCGLKTLLKRQSMRTKFVWPRASSLRRDATAVPLSAARPRCLRFRTCCVSHELRVEAIQRQPRRQHGVLDVEQAVVARRQLRRRWSRKRLRARVGRVDADVHDLGHAESAHSRMIANRALVPVGVGDDVDGDGDAERARVAPAPRSSSDSVTRLRCSLQPLLVDRLDARGTCTRGRAASSTRNTSWLRSSTSPRVSR